MAKNGFPTSSTVSRLRFDSPRARLVLRCFQGGEASLIPMRFHARVAVIADHPFILLLSIRRPNAQMLSQTPEVIDGNSCKIR